MQATLAMAQIARMPTNALLASTIATRMHGAQILTDRSFASVNAGATLGRVQTEPVTSQDCVS